MNRLTICNADGSVSQPANVIIKSVFERLAEYEDAEEAGRLIKLPCAVGDTVYVIKRNEVKTYTVNHFTIIKNGVYAYLVISYSEKSLVSVDDFGKTVFLTRKEAEAALKGADE